MQEGLFLEALNMKNIKVIALSLLVVITELYNNVQSMENNIVQQHTKNNIVQLQNNTITDEDILNRLENDKNTTIRSVAEEFGVSIDRVEDLYTKNNELARWCMEIIGWECTKNEKDIGWEHTKNEKDIGWEYTKNEKDIGWEYTKNGKNIYWLLEEIRKKVNNNISIEDVIYIAYKMDMLDSIAELSKDIQLKWRERNMLNNIYASNCSIPEITKKTGIPQYELMEIYLRNDLIARVVYATVEYIIYNKEETTWENFLDTFKFIATTKYKINEGCIDEIIHYPLESDKTDITKILFKLGESDNIKFYE